MTTVTGPESDRGISACANVDVNSGTQIYQLGYLLGEFIVSRYGRASYLRLIQTNADIPGVLGISTADFEAAWQSYVRQRYLS